MTGDIICRGVLHTPARRTGAYAIHPCMSGLTRHLNVDRALIICIIRQIRYFSQNKTPAQILFHLILSQTERFSDLKMISGRKYQGPGGFRFFTRRVKSVKQTKFRLPDIQPVYLKKTAQFRFIPQTGQHEKTDYFLTVRMN